MPTTASSQTSQEVGGKNGREQGSAILRRAYSLAGGGYLPSRHTYFFRHGHSPDRYAGRSRSGTMEVRGNFPFSLLSFPTPVSKQITYSTTALTAEDGCEPF